MLPQDNASNVSILVLNWNNYADTKKCIDSLLSLAYANFEIVLIDNGSSDDSFQKLKEEFSHEAKLSFMWNLDNLGYAGGINVGIQVALARRQADFVWILNNDIVVERDSLAHLVRAVLSSPDIGIAGPTIYYEGTNQVMEQYYDLSLLRGRFIVKTDLNSDGIAALGNKEQRYIGGAAIFLKMATLVDLGPIPDEYFMYNEDVAWHQRIKNTHWQYLYVGPAKVWHKRSASSGGRRSIMPDYYDTRNFFYFIQKYYASWLPYEILLSFFNKVLPKILKGEWRRLRYVSFGFRDFIKGKMGKFQN